MDLEGKIALVTGAGSGLGKASALQLARKGADVAVLSRTKEEVDAVVDQIAGMGRTALPLYADVSDTADMQAAFDTIAQDFGRLDIVFANAGINGTWAPIDELAAEDWDQTIAVNLRGTFLTLHHAVPLMTARGGSIVITSSINGTRTFTTAGASAYATTKGGQLALGQMAALELAKHRIRVNIICPGAIESQIDENTTRQNTEKAAEPAVYPEGKIPLTDGAPGKAEDVADLVCFLGSDASRHITGTPIWIDGGQSLLV
ncbi:SDR family oxidoreductase [Pelagibacterium lacus]|uniref:SDR family NAD(P)-dependent oxidoreductase n=1 Tax=Pelagibacterium lacus TaxID=2282655 RepID=A0A369W631_9HYPH|nr:SDR family NAD(P)-dependent oxidoreductase [Pelagibacterium lacus]RDE09793.1 SDR family NAD(P)-dependent oxidoreductase [Pelagibacterium lacus]